MTFQIPDEELQVVPVEPEKKEEPPWMVKYHELDKRLDQVLEQIRQRQHPKD